MNEALFYIKQENSIVQCQLCPHACIIKPDKYGICSVRFNENGKLFTENYGIASSIAVDPIEKKPLYHYYPGKNILSIGSYGCNFHCKCCQNHEIAQHGINEYQALSIRPKEIISRAQKAQNNIGIAFTYNEPIIWFEYMLDIAQKAKQENLKTVMVSNGYINPKPLKELIPYLDALNIDFKTYDESTYKHYFGGSTKVVLQTIEQLLKNNKHVEVTYLLINELNDNNDKFERLVKGFGNNFGKDLVLHISKAFPRYQSNIPPTYEKTMTSFYLTAKQHLDFVYLGNVNYEDINNTICPNCETILIHRSYYSTSIQSIDNEGNCQICGKKVITNK